MLVLQFAPQPVRLARESAAVKQARDAIRALSKSVRKRIEGVANMHGEEIKNALR